MRKFTLLLSLLFVMVTTAMAQLEEGKLYRIKNPSGNTYATFLNYTTNGEARPGEGALQFKNKENNRNQFFLLESSSEAGKYFIKTINDCYVKAVSWNFCAEYKTSNPTTAYEIRLIEGEENLYSIYQTTGHRAGYIGNPNGGTDDGKYFYNDFTGSPNSTAGVQFSFEEVSSEDYSASLNYIDGVYKLHWEYDQRGYLVYHDTDYPDEAKLAGVVNHNPSGHYQLNDEGITCNWYLINSDKLGYSYLFEPTTGKFLSFDKKTTATGGYANKLSVDELTGFVIYPCTLTGREDSYFARVMHNDTKYQLCSGCGDSKAGDPVRWVTNDESDGGIPFKLIAVNDVTVDAGILNEAKTKIANYENKLVKNLIYLEDAISSATSFKETFSPVLGESVGYYSTNANATEIETEIANAQAILDNASNKNRGEITNAGTTLLTSLNNWQENLKLNMPVEGKKYYLKHIKANKYLTIKNLSTGEASGDVVITSNLSVSNKRQIFTFESTGTDNRFFIKTDDGYYISTNHWNFVTSTTQPTSFNDVAPDGGYTLKGIDGKVGILIYQDHGKYGNAQRVGYVSTESNANLSEDPINIFGDKVTYDASTKESALWILEEYEPLSLSVYMIKSEHYGYAAGSAIYYNTTAERWQWKTADRWNKEMWMVIEGHSEEAVPTVDSYDATGTHLRICDYSTGELMRGKSVQIVKINGWDGVYNLQYSTTTNDAVQHAQEDNTELVGWNPATTTEYQASAWSIEYLGLSTDLDKLTDEQLTAMSALEAAYKVGVLFKGAVNGTGLGEYHGGDAVAMNAALTVAEEILAKSIAEIAELDAEAIANINAATATITSESAKFQINQPQTGRYYRIKGGNSGNSLPHYYITGSENSDGGRIALASEPVTSTIYYLDENNHLLSYTAGLYLGVRSGDYNYKFEAVDTPEENIADITFEGSTTKVGLYTIKSADVYLRYKIYEGNVELDKTESISSPEDNWIIEEVESIPVNVSGIGWASLYTPAPLTIPADIEAYYISGFEGAVATLKKIETTIPANTAVILKATKEITIRATYNFAIADDVEAITDNKLEGTVAKETKNTDAYILSAGPDGDAIGLYPLNTNTGTATGGSFINGSHKAYLPVSNAPVAGSNGFSFRFEDGMTTCIDNVNRESDNVETIYDLTGRRVEAITAPGIYIVNGNKVLVK